MFVAAGWQVITLEYGRSLQKLFTRPGGEALRARIDTMTNQEYQRLLRCSAEELCEGLSGTGSTAAPIAALIGSLDDASLLAALRNLGGHDTGALLEAFDCIDDTRPTVILAYTVKGYGLPTEGHPQNHSSLLTADQMGHWPIVCARTSTTHGRPSPTARRKPPCVRRSPGGCTAPSTRPGSPPRCPPTYDLTRPAPTGTGNTEQALGRVLLDLTRRAPEAAGRIVTVSPDVSSSTNLGGRLNKAGVWSPAERSDWFADNAETLLHWRERPTGQHVELGIAETILVGLLGELGATWSCWGQPLLPIGVVYDPFVKRALEPWSFGIYAGGQSILVGTPSGVTLASEGGAHQSINTPSLGIEQPGCVTYEPAFVIDTEWCLLAALRDLGRSDGSSAYLRLSTRPVDGPQPPCPATQPPANAADR